MAHPPAVFGDYLLLRKLGAGAAGDVHLARLTRSSQKDFPSPLVIKRMHRELNAQFRFAQRFQHEAALAMTVDSRHVAKVFDHGTLDGQLYLAMEYVEGWPLLEVLQRCWREKTKLSVASAADVAAGMLVGLDSLSKARSEDGTVLGIVHRDLSPKNVMVTKEGLSCLIDLGIAKSNLQTWKTQTGTVMGTPGYIAPEQAAGDPADHRSDLYAVGVMLWEMLAGEPMIPVTTPLEMLRATLIRAYVPASEDRKDLPKGLDDLVRRSVSLDPADRYSSADEMLQALRSVVPERKQGDAMRTLLTQMRFDLAEKSDAETRIVAVPTPAAEAPWAPAPAPSASRKMLPMALAAGLVAVGGLVLWNLVGQTPTPVRAVEPPAPVVAPQAITVEPRQRTSEVVNAAELSRTKASGGDEAPPPARERRGAQARVKAPTADAARGEERGEAAPSPKKPSRSVDDLLEDCMRLRARYPSSAAVKDLCTDLTKASLRASRGRAVDVDGLAERLRKVRGRLR